VADSKGERADVGRRVPGKVPQELAQAAGPGRGEWHEESVNGRDKHAPVARAKEELLVKLQLNRTARGTHQRISLNRPVPSNASFETYLL